jgi:hypothetical protein
MLTYTIDSVKHVGFTRLTRPSQTVQPDTSVVIAWFDGEPELWIVENASGYIALRKMYTDEWGDREIPFTTLHSVGPNIIHQWRSGV